VNNCCSNSGSPRAKLVGESNGQGNNIHPLRGKGLMILYLIFYVVVCNYYITFNVYGKVMK